MDILSLFAARSELGKTIEGEDEHDLVAATPLWGPPLYLA
jgi:hypothetical protein